MSSVPIVDRFPCVPIEKLPSFTLPDDLGEYATVILTSEFDESNIAAIYSALLNGGYAFHHSVAFGTSALVAFRKEVANG